MSITHLLILLVVVVLIFGTKKLRNIGGDLGGAVRDFKKGLDGGEEAPSRPIRTRACAPIRRPPAPRRPRTSTTPPNRSKVTAAS